MHDDCAAGKKAWRIVISTHIMASGDDTLHIAKGRHSYNKPSK